MPKIRFQLVLRLAITLAVLAGAAGCSRDARKAGHLRKADEYFKAGDYEKAEIEYKNVRQIEGLNPQAIGRLGIIYFEQGRLPQCFAFLSKANELQPENLDVRLKLGALSMAVGKKDEARETAMFVLERRPKDPDAALLLAESVAQPNDAVEARAILEKIPPPATAAVLTALGVLDLKQGKMKEAEAHLVQAQNVDSKFAPAYSVIAGLYLGRKDTISAEKAFATAVEFAPLRSPFRLQFAQFNLQTGKAQAAKDMLENMIKVTPDFLPPYVLRAYIAIQERKHDESIAFLEKLLGREPVHLDALLLLGQTNMAKGDTAKALEVLGRAVTAFPQAAPAHYQLAMIYLAKGDLDSATASLTQATTLAPQFAQATLALANVNIRKRNFEAAINSLKAFLQEHPTNGDAQLLLAEAHRAQGNADAALVIYRQLAAANPKNVQLHLLLGAVLLQQNKRAEARQAYNTALGVQPDSIPVLEQLVNLDLAEKQFAAAESRVAAEIAKHPSNASLHLLLAKVASSQGSNEKAEAALKKAVELQPESPAAYLLLSQIYLQTRQADKALEQFEIVAKKEPKNIGVLTTMGVLQEQKKDFKAARQSYEQVLSLNPKSVAVLNNLAYLLSEQFGEVDKALEYAQRAREIAPNLAEANDTLGWVLFRKGHFARAAGLLEESSEKLGENAEARFHQGMARYMMGDEAGARTALEQALKLNANFPGAAEAREALGILTLDVSKGGEAARKTLLAALEKRKDDPIALTRLAAAYERDNAPDKALATYEAALKSNPGNTTAALNAIRLYRARKEATKALELAKSTRKIAPSDGRLAHVLGRLAFENGEYAYSAAVLRDAARAESSNADVAFDFGEASYSVGQVASAEAAFRDALAANTEFSRAAKAREYLELISAAQDTSAASAAHEKAAAALKSDPTNVAALMAKGAGDQQKGDHVSAVQAYEKALTRYPDFTPAKRNLAILYSQQPGDERKAVEYATKAREAFPNDAEVAKALGVLLYRQGNHTRAASLLEESARSRRTDAEVQYYLGLAQQQLKNASASKRALERALELGLSEKYAAEARRLLAAD